jgi:hypothetical protein
LFGNIMKLSFETANNWSDFPDCQRETPWQPGNGKDEICFVAEQGSAEWKIRLNDFPDEPLYTLIADEKEIIHFDDWPSFWTRPEFPTME